MKISLILVVILLSMNVAASNLPNFPFVVSKGNSEKKVVPDIATIHINFLSFDENSERALAGLNNSSEKLMQVLENNRIDLKKLEARDMRKDTKRKKDRDYNSLEILGYEVSRSMTLKLDDLGNYSKLMNDFISIDNLSSINTVFDVKDREAYEAELMDLAGKDARKKAELMAKSLGSQIKSVYAISQESNFDGFFATFGAPEIQAFYEGESGNYGRARMLVPEFVFISQNINVVFRIK